MKRINCNNSESKAVEFILNGGRKFKAASAKVSGKPFTKEAAMAKYYAAETAREVTNMALQVHGGYGYMSEYPLERMYRDAKLMGIYEGTNEIHKVVIARAVLN